MACEKNGATARRDPLTVENVLLSSNLLVQPLSCYFASATEAVEVGCHLGMAEAMPFPKLALPKSLRSFAPLDNPFDSAQGRLWAAVPRELSCSRSYSRSFRIGSSFRCGS